jgi:hypothetical protein
MHRPTTDRHLEHYYAVENTDLFMDVVPWQTANGSSIEK